MIKQLIRGEILTEDQSYQLFKDLVDCPIAQQAAILTLFASRKITVSELMGALNYFVERAIKIHYPHPVIDIVGTGGDGYGTINISTAASLIVASTGIKVAKHGGRSSTSKSGSVDVIEELGIPISLTGEQIIDRLDLHHYGYICGPYFNPVLKSLAPLRKSLGFKTLLNILSPLANPIQPSKLALGVSGPEWVPLIIEVLKRLGKERAMVYSSEEGMDELSISSATYVAELKKDGKILEYKITPEEVGLTRAPIAEIIGGNPKENAAIIRKIIKGKLKGPMLDVVLLNAASGFVVSGLANDLYEGVVCAQNAIQSARTFELLQTLCLDKENENV